MNDVVVFDMEKGVAELMMRVMDFVYIGVVVCLLVSQEFELSCQLVLPLHERNEKSSIKWTIWKTLSELQAFDECVTVTKLTRVGLAGACGSCF